MRRTTLSLPAVAAVLLLSGCGDPTATEPGGGGGGGGPTTVAPSPTRPSSPVSPSITVSPPIPVSPSTPVVPPTKPGKPGGSARPITIDGVVESGVEPGCKVLTANGAAYQVIGGQVPVGVPVRITGVLQPGVLTTCQQGTPIRVTKVERR